jgi:signal transduction histidine kinase
MSAGDLPRDAEETLALAHALRTPLTALSLGLGLLDQGELGPLGDAQREVVHMLLRELDRLTLLIDGALRIERLGPYAGPIERAPVELGALICDAALPIAAQAEEKGVAVLLGVREEVVVVADPVKLAWVVSSLMGNALRYSPPGASIEVELEVRAAGEGEERATLRIGDHGAGISAEKIDRIFERGGGRGLFLAKEIVEAHGGRILLDSAPGEGSVFTITLPIATNRAHEREQERSRS